MNPPPKIDPRSAKDVAARTRSLLSGWNPQDPFGNALVQAFGRLCEIVIERLNQVPERNFLAFLDMLGASRLPPQPARVPLAFSLAAGRVEDALVPAGTQAAAPPLEGEKEPAIFETERELWVAAVELASVVARDPRLDAHADYSALAGEGLPAGAPLFLSSVANEHVFYLAHDRLLDFPAIDAVSLDFAIEALPADPDARELRWEIWDGAQGKEISPLPPDGTDGLRRSGTVGFDFTALGPVPRSEVAGRSSRWLRCRLLTPVSGTELARQAMARASHLPRIRSVTLTVVVNRTGLAPAAAFANQASVDLTKDWLPFGERPRIGEAFLLAQDEAFARSGAVVTLKLKPTTGVTVRAEGNPQVRWEFWDGAAWRELMTSDAKGDIKRDGVALADTDFADETGALTFQDRALAEYEVKFRLDPPSPQPLEVGGVARFWVRARLVAGDYGKEASYVQDTSTTPPGYKLEPATLAPPMLASLLVDYTLQTSDAPQAIRTRNEFQERDVAVPLASPFTPFEPPPGERPELYLGFRLPKGRKRFPNRTLSLYPVVARLRYGERRAPLHPAVSAASAAPGGVAVHRFALSNPAPQPQTFLSRVLGSGWTAAAPAAITVPPGEAAEITVGVTLPAGALAGAQDEAFLMLAPQQAAAQVSVARLVTTASGLSAPVPAAALSWQYWSGAAWKALSARDDTERLARPGTFSFLVPPDIAAGEQCGVERYWLRIVWDKGEFATFPFVQRLMPNAVMASQTVTLAKEILGSSDGSEHQRFRTTRAPVLAAPELEVREPELPPLEEQKALQAVFGDGAVDVVRDATGRPSEIWVRWQQVDDFYGSGPRDRHYVIDHVTGEVRFSDGVNGLLPPRGRGNVRMRRYRTGGTAGGNRAAGTIAQLKTTVPYVERVTNPEPAAGGADAESLESLRDRVPREIRHRHRSVTQEDYEDLAVRATPEVARARCIPLRALDEDPLGGAPRLGRASVIVVPRSAQAKPLPSAELLARVHGYLRERADATAAISVVGPLYVRVDVTVEVVVADPDAARTVEQAVRARLHAFLHPLTGGLDGRGWDFGREPYRSDFYSLVHSIAGVDHIRSLEVDEVEELPGAKATGRYLVYSGEHHIGLSSTAD